MTLWSAVMTEVVEMPEAMAPASEWVVAFRAMRVNAGAAAHDARRWCGMTGPSFTVPAPTTETVVRHLDMDSTARSAKRSTVRVTWELHPETVLRKVIPSRMRNRMLRSEVPASSSALSTLLVAGRP
jgi:hypothetical protein